MTNNQNDDQQKDYYDARMGQVVDAAMGTIALKRLGSFLLLSLALMNAHQLLAGYSNYASFSGNAAAAIGVAFGLSFFLALADIAGYVVYAIGGLESIMSGSWQAAMMVRVKSFEVAEPLYIGFRVLAATLALPMLAYFPLLGLTVSTNLGTLVLTGLAVTAADMLNGVLWTAGVVAYDRLKKQ